MIRDRLVAMLREAPTTPREAAIVLGAADDAIARELEALERAGVARRCRVPRAWLWGRPCHHVAHGWRA